jgi:CubicO group peptidase (beta-lactamase class C family)
MACSLAGVLWTVAGWTSDCLSTSYVETPARYTLAAEQSKRLICEKLWEIPAVQVAVAVDGKLVWSEAFGHADLARRIRTTNHTMFRIGSVSKPLTAYAVALLVADGKLDLDAPVQKYVPSFPAKEWPVTPRQLAGHLGGVRGYIKDYEENRSTKGYPTVTSGLAIFAADPLLFEPGSKFSYSTYGFSLLSAAIEGASGMNFPAYLQKNVFGPLGLRHTSIDLVGRRIADRAQVYEPVAEKLEIAPKADNSYKWAGGGLLSTAEDLVRFGSAHLEPSRLSRASLDLLFTSQRTAGGEETGYGIGWYTGTDEHGHRVVSHAGSAVGGSAMFVVDRDSRVVFAMLLNVTGTAEVGEMLGPVWSVIPKLFDTAH